MVKVEYVLAVAVAVAVVVTAVESSVQLARLQWIGCGRSGQHAKTLTGFLAQSTWIPGFGMREAIGEPSRSRDE